MNSLNIIINNNIIQGNPGESVLDLCNRNGINIPTLCHDPRLEPYSSCYLCVVEVQGMRGLQPACSTRITEGMKVETDNDRVRKSRKFALELLVSNHYADCIAPCKSTCPAGVDVQGYIALINQGKYNDAAALIRKTNPLPAICGRVCVRPCEVACRRNLVEGVPVGIDYLKRFAADKDLETANRLLPQIKPASGKKAAVIGAGPGGLTAAWFLASEGHEVELFEASNHPGGMLRYGIPPYRLPNEVIDKEVQGIEALGVKIHYNKKLGVDISYARLKEKFNAVVLAIGSQNGTSIGCENDDAENIFSGIDFLRNMEMTGQKYDFTGKKVAVIGGGNTAMDCCRTAMRCGSTDVTVLYRRTEKEMPANPIEIHESKLEGIKYAFLTAPARVNKNSEGVLKSLTCYRMELGEPDASGRRRPVKVDGSEFDLELDYILAAIGQKTDVNFIDDINASSQQELIINKWGDIQADAATLQTSIDSVFACGDGVTGPATLIEAIAQGRRAAFSCSKFLLGEEVTGPEYEFISRKDNFKKQLRDDYESWYENQVREEMPVLDPVERYNFNEVELGYTPQQAHYETLRCLECGCSEYYTCDLKKYSTEYKVEQKNLNGSCQQFHVDFSHAHIEIDNNKCILCARCVRICKEVVGANALGLVNRGFDTYVAPSLGNKLTDTLCESCGLCISTCPTGAITENVPFKAGPLALESFESICNFCSVGCTVSYHHKTGFVTRVAGASGMVNHDGNICGFPRFGYKYLNNKSRITQPLMKKIGSFSPVSFEEAYEVIVSHIASVKGAENAFAAGARLTNEEIFLVQKLARAGAAGNNFFSFHYLDRGDGYKLNSIDNVPFDQLEKAGRIYLIGSEINEENPVAGFYIYNNCYRNNISLTVITSQSQSSMKHKADATMQIKSYYSFVKAVSHFILSNGLENRIFLNDHCPDWESYRRSLLTEDYQTLINDCGCRQEDLEAFATEYNNEQHAILVFSEKHMSSAACTEVRNLAMITGKLGKTASGIMALKEKNNSQGLMDITALTNQAPVEISTIESTTQLLQTGKIKNLFVFGEDPAGTAIDKQSFRDILEKIDFMVVQDYFMSETALMADLILPASLPFETGGSFTNFQRYIQQIEISQKSPVSESSFQQLTRLLNLLGQDTDYASPADAMQEIAGQLYNLPRDAYPRKLVYTATDDCNRMFEHGCDYLGLTAGL